MTVRIQSQSPDDNVEALAFFLSLKEMPNSLNSLRVLRMAHLEQKDFLSRTFPAVPNEFRVSGDKQDSLLINPRRLGHLMG